MLLLENKMKNLYSHHLALLFLALTSGLDIEMNAIVQLTRFGALSLGTVGKPIPKEHEILIQVHYTALNRMDLLQRDGKYPIPPGASEILGVEVSGVVVAIGPNCTSNIATGDEVMALLDGGGYAEFAVCNEKTVIKKFPWLNMQQAAAVPEAFITSYQLLYVIANMQQNESVLIHTCASSIGLILIQMALLKNITVFVTSRHHDKLEKCLSYEGTRGVVIDDSDKSNISFASQLVAMNGNNPIDVVLDPVGATYLSENVKTLAVDGRYVSYGLLSGNTIPDYFNNNSITTETFLRVMLFKRISFLPTTLRNRSLQYKHNIIARILDEYQTGAMDVSTINIHVSDVFPFEQVKEAHIHMSQNRNSGKILLAVKGSIPKDMDVNFANTDNDTKIRSTSESVVDSAASKEL